MNHQIIIHCNNLLIAPINCFWMWQSKYIAKRSRRSEITCVAVLTLQRGAVGPLDKACWFLARFHKSITTEYHYFNSTTLSHTPAYHFIVDWTLANCWVSFYELSILRQAAGGKNLRQKLFDELSVELICIDVCFRIGSRIHFKVTWKHTHRIFWFRVHVTNIFAGSKDLLTTHNYWWR